MSPFRHLIDLACARMGGRVLAANDEFFAEKENLVRDEPPVWEESRYTDRGKWMDGWETRRRREPGHDWCIVRLGFPGITRGVVVDTAHFRGNYPESCWLEGTVASRDASVESLLADDTAWHPVLPRQRLSGDAQNEFPVDAPWACTHLRFHIDPDGGVARLRVHGEVVADLPSFPPHQAVDLAALERGAAVVSASDMFFGSRHHLILPGPSRGMHDGWETKRRRGPGHDWAVVRLAGRGAVERVLVDTSHFKGNAPGTCALDLADLAPGGGEAEPGEADWTECLPLRPLRPHAEHEFAVAGDGGPATHARLRIYPDGGVARLRLFGRLDARGREDVGLRWLHTLPPPAAARELLQCLACAAWVRRVVEGRPFASRAALLAAAEIAFDDLARGDWEAALVSHPRIGESAPAGGGHEPSARERQWSEQEQGDVWGADPDLQRRLAEGNRRYEERFGRIFLIRAAGRTAGEILQALETRLGNAPDAEIEVAASELRDIARRRLERMVTG